MNTKEQQVTNDCGTVAGSQRDSSRTESIWRNQKTETEYWLAEWMDGCGVKNVSIHRMECGGVEHTIIFDIEDKSAVLIETDSTAPTVEESHKYMMIDSHVMEKMAEIFRQANTPTTATKP